MKMQDDEFEFENKFDNLKEDDFLLDDDLGREVDIEELGAGLEIAE